MTIIEVMIAALVLVVGMVGIAVLFSTAATSTQRTKLDTNSTLVAKMVLEQISAQTPTSTANITLVDCAGTSWTINTVGDTYANGGSGAPLDNTSSSITYGGIDFSKSAVTGYSMQYKDCGNGQATTYDVRWNIINISPGYTRMITVGAHQLNLAYDNLGHSYFAIPVSLRGMAGPSQQ